MTEKELALWGEFYENEIDFEKRYQLSNGGGRGKLKNSLLFNINKLIRKRNERLQKKTKV